MKEEIPPMFSTMIDPRLMDELNALKDLQKLKDVVNQHIKVIKQLNEIIQRQDKRLFLLEKRLNQIDREISGHGE